jgi:NAD(P)H-dependent FMN reductase
MCHEILGRFGNCDLIDLRDFDPANFDNHEIYHSEAYTVLHAKIADARGIVLASPVYNWSCCAEAKKLIEYTGSTPSKGGRAGAWFDKVVTFVNAGGLPHSYMAFVSMAASLMLDFKCIINPYNVYVDSAQWADGALSEDARNRLDKSMHVLRELSGLLAGRTYRSKWEI